MALQQAGAISSTQLRASGLTSYRQTRLVEEGILLPTRRAGLFVLPVAPRGWLQTLWLELLAAGPEALAWRRSAAQLWQLDGVAANGQDVDIAVPARRRPRRAVVTRLSSLAASHVCDLQGVPCTSAARTLADLGGAVTADRVERALESALRRRLVKLPELQAMSTSLRTPAARVLRQVLARRRPGTPPTESDAETCFLQSVRSAGLPEPERQILVVLRGRRYRLDAGWRSIRLAAEVDGASTHGPDRLTADLRRQNLIVLDGWMVLRFSAALVMNDPAAVARDLVEAFNVRALQLGRR